MPTLNQFLYKKGRIKRIKKSRAPAMKKRPHLRGIVQRVLTMKPKKPNSALRKIAKVRLSTKRLLTVYIPGLGHDLRKHSTVLVRGGRVPDLPGIRYHIVRGKLDFKTPERFERKNRRSKFGKKNPIIREKRPKVKKIKPAKRNI